MTNAVYIAATRQHVGKTSTCLGLLKGLTSRFENVGYIKPVGQQHTTVDGGLKVDKDVPVAKEVFKLDKCSYADMSPVIIPPGYTRNYLDGDVDTLDADQLDRIKRGFENISKQNDFTVVEGTGHTGVGSIVNMNNARVAAELGLDMVSAMNNGALFMANLPSIPVNLDKECNQRTIYSNVGAHRQWWNWLSLR